MIQIDGSRRQVFIKFVDLQYVQEVQRTTKGQSEYKHSNGEISSVHIEMAEMGTKRARDSQPAPEIDEGTMWVALAQYGEIGDTQEEKWSNAYRNTVAKGARIVVIILTKHVQSHLTIGGHRVLASYDGQPMTSYGCGDTGHVYQVCHRRRREE